MKVWSYHIPTRIHFGQGILEKLEEILKGYSDTRRVLIISGRHHIQTSGLREQLTQLVERARKEPIFYTKVPPEPTVEAVEEALAFAKSVWPHIVVGVGGGSPLDVAKVVAMMLINGGDVASLIGVYEPFPKDGIPYIAIPTTSGSGSEVTPYAVIIDPSVPRKAPIVSRRSFPVHALVDPKLTISCSPDLTARTGVDALSHCIEAFLSQKALPLTDLAAKEGARLVFQHLTDAVRYGENLELREKMALASLMGGLAIAGAGAGLIHQLGHALAVFNGISHGEAMALFMVPVLEFYGEAAQDKLEVLALQGEIDPSEFINWLRGWLASIELPTSLRDVEYDHAWKDQMVELVMSRKSVLETLPLTPTPQDLKDLLEKMASPP